jgi:hypothetical protein
MPFKSKYVKFLIDIQEGDFAVTICTTDVIEFSRCKLCKVYARFCGGEITSDGGVMLLHEADRRLRLTERIAPLLPDPRVKSAEDNRFLPATYGEFAHIIKYVG